MGASFLRVFFGTETDSDCTVVLSSLRAQHQPPSWLVLTLNESRTRSKPHQNDIFNSFWVSICLKTIILCMTANTCNDNQKLLSLSHVFITFLRCTIFSSHIYSRASTKSNYSFYKKSSFHAATWWNCLKKEYDTGESDLYLLVSFLTLHFNPFPHSAVSTDNPLLSISRTA